MKTVISAALAAFLSLAVPVAVMAKSDSVPKAESKTAEEVIDFAKLFNNKLTDAKGKRVKSESLAKTKYVAVYFSAHWCGPCRQFTPELVKFTKENRKDGNFEVVFISLDTSDKAMLEYMKEAEMPWGGMLGKGAKLKGINDGVTGIPHLRVYEVATGKRVAAGQHDAIATLKSLIAAK